MTSDWWSDSETRPTIKNYSFPYVPRDASLKVVSGIDEIDLSYYRDMRVYEHQNIATML